MWHAAAYFDESDDNERAYAVAGFIGHQHDCVHFDLAWKDRILDKYGLEYFKASELNAGTEQFAKFRDDPNNVKALFSPREKDFFNRIKAESIDIINEFDLLVGVGAVLDWADYDRIVTEWEVRGRVVPAPYFFCAQLVMMECGLMMNQLNSTTSSSQQGLVRPVFDSHEEYEGRAKRLYNEFVQKNPLSAKSLLPPHYEDERDYLMLQAADNLAYECRRLLITEDYAHLPERKAMTRLKERVARIYKLNYEGLNVILRTNNPDVIPIAPTISNPGRVLK